MPLWFHSLASPFLCGFQVDGDTMTYENEIFFTELISTSVSKRYVMTYPSVAFASPQQRLGEFLSLSG